MAKKKKNEEVKTIVTEETKNSENKSEVVEVSDKLKRCKAYRARLVIRKRK